MFKFPHPSVLADKSHCHLTASCPFSKLFKPRMTTIAGQRRSKTSNASSANKGEKYALVCDNEVRSNPTTLLLSGQHTSSHTPCFLGVPIEPPLSHLSVHLKKTFKRTGLYSRQVLTGTTCKSSCSALTTARAVRARASRTSGPVHFRAERWIAERIPSMSRALRGRSSVARRCVSPPRPFCTSPASEETVALM